jgi:hypothetical protein
VLGAQGVEEGGLRGEGGDARRVAEVRTALRRLQGENRALEVHVGILRSECASLALRAAEEARGRARAAAAGAAVASGWGAR